MNKSLKKKKKKKKKKKSQGTTHRGRAYQARKRHIKFPANGPKKRQNNTRVHETFKANKS